MKCKQCGAEIESGFLYCPKCGQSIQLVPDYNVLEEELLSRVVEDKDKAKDDRFATGVYKPVAKTAPKSASKSASDSKASTSSSASKNKGVITKIVIFFSIVAVGVCCIISFIGGHSYDHLMNKAVEAEANQHYAKALGYFEEAYSIDNSSFEVLYGLGRMYYQVKEYENAIAYLLMALELDNTNKKIYTYLLECYDELGDTDGLIHLAENAPNDEIKLLFEDYILIPPTFSFEGGDYDSNVILKLETVGDNQIFYTLNGKNPTITGKLFTKPIEISEGTTEVKAVTMNSEGEYSEVVSQTYVVKYTAPDMPVVTPEAGTFNEEVFISISVPTGGTAYYSWDGSDPLTNGTLYEKPFKIIPGSSVLSVVTVDVKGNVSPVYHGEYIYNR